MSRLVERFALANGYAITKKGFHALSTAVNEMYMTIKDSEGLFCKLRAACSDRCKKCGIANNVIVAEDILGIVADFREEDPNNALENLVGLTDLKKRVKDLVAKSTASATKFRLNVLFMGNPGTGKTVVAKLFSKILARQRLLEDPKKLIFTTADDVRAKGTNGIKKLFDENKGGVIFVDEFHQLNDVSGDTLGEGAKTLKAMVAYLEDDRYKTTVFIGAGYRIPVEQMNGNEKIDPGLCSRFPEHNRLYFSDYNADEIETIGRSLLKKLKVDVADEAVMQELVRTVMHAQRMEMNPGNARTVRTTVEAAINKKDSRGGTVLDLSDVSLPPPKPVSIDESNPPDLLAFFAELKQTAAYSRKNGDPLHKSIPMRYILQGPPGTGKTTTAQCFADILHSVGILPSSEVIVKTAKDFIAGYVGQTALKVETALSRRGDDCCSLTKSAASVTTSASDPRPLSKC